MILLLLFQLTSAIISPAKYIYSNERPLIAAHRGLCSLFPENTLQSFEAAMYQGTDFIELDVVINKENKVIVAHDTYLSSVSDIMDKPEFLSRLKVRTLNGKDKEDWWIYDFTEIELKTIGIKQIRAPYRSRAFDSLFTYPTLQEVLQLLLDFNVKLKGQRNPDKRPVGILLEMKDYAYHKFYTDQEIADLVIADLKKFGVDTINGAKDRIPIVLMSFDQESVKRAQQISDLPRVQLVSNLVSTQYVIDTAQYANIIGPDVDSLWDKTTQKPKPILQDIRNQTLLVYGWTFQDDQSGTQNLFNITNSHELYKKAINELKLDGIITEFSDVAISYVQVYRKLSIFD